MEESVKVSDAGLFNEMEASFLKVPTQVSDSMIQKSWDLCKDLLGGNCKKTASKRSSRVAFSTAVWYRMGGSTKCKGKKRTRREGSWQFTLCIAATRCLLAPVPNPGLYE